jgi:SAM-dependent MidA family methyltransferase
LKKGYYSGGAQKFGEKGDFITAPETSDLSSQVAHNALVHKSPKHYTHTITISLFIIEILTKRL